MGAKHRAAALALHAQDLHELSHTDLLASAFWTRPITEVKVVVSPHTATQDVDFQSVGL